MIYSIHVKRQQHKYQGNQEETNINELFIGNNNIKSNNDVIELLTTTATNKE